jgi:hypothetical protein
MQRIENENRTRQCNKALGYNSRINTYKTKNHSTRRISCSMITEIFSRKKEMTTDCKECQIKCCTLQYKHEDDKRAGDTN